MGCNCGRRRTAAAQPRRTVRSGTTDGLVFTLIKRDGSQERYGSRLEADAANARSGYTGIVRQQASNT